MNDPARLWLRLFCLRRPHQRIAPTRAASTATPPTTPPAMAPVFCFLDTAGAVELEAAALAVGEAFPAPARVGDSVEELLELELLELELLELELLELELVELEPIELELVAELEMELL